MKNFQDLAIRSYLDGLFVDAPISAFLSYAFGEKLPDTTDLLNSASIAALAYSIRHIARGKLENPENDVPVPLWGAIAGAIKYGTRYSLNHRNDFNTLSFLYTSARGALNVFLYESFRQPIGNIIVDDESISAEKILALGVIFSAFETIDSILAGGPSLISIFSGVATGFTTSAFVMLSENITFQDKLLMVASSSVLYSLHQNPYDICLGIAIAYTLNNIASSFVDMIVKEQNEVLAR